MSRTVSEISQRFVQSMQTLDPTPLADVFAADAVYELPFLGPRAEGREAILATLTAGSVRARALGLEHVQVETRELADGFVAELSVEGRNSHTGATYGFPSSVGLVTIHNGEITAYRGFSNTAAAHTMTGAATVFQQFLDASVENRWDDLADLYAEDVVLEMPFTPAGVARLTHGREELPEAPDDEGGQRHRARNHRPVRARHGVRPPRRVRRRAVRLVVRDGPDRSRRQDRPHPRLHRTAAAAKRITALRSAPPED